MISISGRALGLGLLRYASPLVVDSPHLKQIHKRRWLIVAQAAGILVLDVTVILLTYFDHKYIKDPYFALIVLIDFFAGFLILLALILKCVATIPPESEAYRWASVGLQCVVV